MLSNLSLQFSDLLDIFPSPLLQVEIHQHTSSCVFITVFVQVCVGPDIIEHEQL